MTDGAPDGRFAVPRRRLASGRAAVAWAVAAAGAATAGAGFVLDVGTALVGGTAVVSAALIALVLLAIPGEDADSTVTE